VVQLSNGKSASGLIRRETADAIYLVTSERVEVRIPRSQIESLQASRTSVMPQGLEAPLSRQELGDLIMFLKSLR
jgi:putative heme-binding domain-containing protein